MMAPGAWERLALVLTVLAALAYALDAWVSRVLLLLALVALGTSFIRRE